MGILTLRGGQKYLLAVMATPVPLRLPKQVKNLPTGNIYDAAAMAVFYASVIYATSKTTSSCPPFSVYFHQALAVGHEALALSKLLYGNSHPRTAACHDSLGVCNSNVRPFLFKEL